jgi:hypothetical protein
MSVLNVTCDELFALVRTCDTIHIEECTPPNLRDFICRRLEKTAPAMAKSLVPKVVGLDEHQMDELCEYIQQTHRLIARHLRRRRRSNGPSDAGAP